MSIRNTLLFESDSYFRTAAASSIFFACPKAALPGYNRHGDGFASKLSWLSRRSRPGAGVMLPSPEESKTYKFQDETKDRSAQVAILIFLAIHF